MKTCQALTLELDLIDGSEDEHYCCQPAEDGTHLCHYHEHMALGLITPSPNDMGDYLVNVFDTEDCRYIHVRKPLPKTVEFRAMLGAAGQRRKARELAMCDATM